MDVHFDNIIDGCLKFNTKQHTNLKIAKNFKNELHLTNYSIIIGNW